MIIKELKLEDRPLQRLIKKGPQVLSNVELLAIILFHKNLYFLFSLFNLQRHVFFNG